MNLKKLKYYKTNNLITIVNTLLSVNFFINKE